MDFSADKEKAEDENKGNGQGLPHDMILYCMYARGW
jgi:hypothetical protein